jgi:HD-GYP domain-containing protein (c-di-GMP phosphodiesterase class II)
MTSEMDLLEKVATATQMQSGDRALNRLLETIVEEVRGYAQSKASEIRRLTEIGISLSSERRLEKLLERIVDEARVFTNADGGTLYIVEQDNDTDPVLKFEIMQNESMGTRQGGTSGNAITLPPIPLIVDGKENCNNVSAYVGNSGETVNIPDVYTAEGFDFSGPRKFDQVAGYRTQSMLVAPLRNHEDEIIGVLALINAREPGTSRTIPFSPEYEDLIKSLASQAAVAITNTKLIHDLRELFNSVIRLVASAIDEKSPYTGGHISRVAGLTMKIAEVINKTTEGEYADVSFDEDDLEELRIAAWLHDIGKITTPEYIVDKATKLETIYDRVGLVQTRYELIKEVTRKEALEEKVTILTDGGDATALAAVDTALDAKLTELDDEAAFIAKTNLSGEFLADESVERLEAIAAKTFQQNGEDIPYLTSNELENLCIRKGSLLEEEREIIQNHVVMTTKMLSQIPFSRKLSHVVEYAGAHHEKMNGKGYPNGWGADKLMIQSRMLCLADICEALTARDRPYKPAMPKDVAYKILGFMTKDGELDPELVDFFKERDIYEHFMAEYVAERTKDLLSFEMDFDIADKKALLLGISKETMDRDTKEITISPDPHMHLVIEELQAKGLEIVFYDGHVKSIEAGGAVITSLPAMPEGQIPADLTILVNKSSQFDFMEFATSHTDKPIIDSGNHLKKTNNPHLTNVLVP